MLLTVDLDRLEIARGDLLLDAGCGEGRHSFGALARGARVVALDLDMDSMRPHRKRLNEAVQASAAGNGAPHVGAGSAAATAGAPHVGGFVRGDTFALPFTSARFDHVICAEVMEHVHDYRAAARELARVTKLGGRVAVTIPTASSEHLYLRLGDDYFESPGGHIRIFRPRELARALAAAGLRTEGASFAHGLHTLYWALRSLVGLPRADEFRAVRAFRTLLIRASGSPLMDAFEKRVLNWLCPKSVILYARKVCEPRPPAA